MNIVWIVSGASLGALARYSLQLFTAKYLFTIGTLSANLIGCFLIGLAYSFSSQMSQEVRLGIITGFLGSLTTMSSFSLDLVKLIEQKEWFTACGLAVMTLAGGVLLTLGGAYIGQKIKG